MNILYLFERKARSFLSSRDRQRIEGTHGVRLSSDVPVAVLKTAETIKAYSAEISNLLDVGAHKGLFTFAMQRFWRFDKIVCVEPNRDLHDALRRQVGPEVEVVEAALGSFSGQGAFFLHPDPSMSSLVPVDRDNFEEGFPFYSPDAIGETRVDVRPLDAMIGRFPATSKRDILLKLDTQGNELEILRGGERFLDRVSFAVVEWMFWRGYENESTLEELIGFMSERAFDCVGVLAPARRASGKVAYADFLFLARAK